MNLTKFTSELGASALRPQTPRMRNYGQFCPVARGSEILAERWTPIILRNVLLGCDTFNEIAAGAPGLSRALLTRRLRELERAGVIEIRPKPGGRGSLYEPTPAGRDLWPVLNALGGWAQRWMELKPDHAHPDVVLWSWFGGFLRRDLLPDRRLVVRFDFEVLGRRVTCWLLIERRESEICSFDPGFGDDLVVTIADSLAFARWHLGLVDWAAALRSGGIQVTGPADLRRALPTWNRGPEIHAQQRAEHERSPGGTPPLPPAAPAEQVGARPEPSIIPGFLGELVTPEHPDYDQARAVWNGAIDRRPRYIACCRSPSDVSTALRFGRDRDLSISVRGGGHGVAGVCDDGLVIDLGVLKAITVDPAQRTATVAAGVRWGELDAATQAFALATTGAFVSHAGVCAHTLAGGAGWLMRRHGLSADNLLAAEVVTADGQHLAVSERDHPDLFWGLRGGGGGLGVVTSFTYRLHPVGPEVLAGPVLWALDDAPQVLRAYRELAASATPEVATTVTLRRAPPVPFLPVELHRRPVCQVTMLALADPDRAVQLLAPLRALGRPLLDLVKHRPYTNLQSMNDAAAPSGRHYAGRSAGLRQLDDDVIDAMVERAHQAHSPWSAVDLHQLGGAVAEVDRNATAYFGRDVPFELNVTAAWLPHEPVGAAETAWAEAFVADLEAQHAGADLVVLDRDDDRTPAASGSGASQRLVQLRHRFDPDHVLQPRRSGTRPR